MTPQQLRRQFDDEVKRLVDAAPPFTDQQRARLFAIVRPASVAARKRKARP